MSSIVKIYLNFYLYQGKSFIRINILVVPRMLFDGWSGQDFASLLSKDKEKRAISRTFFNVCKKYGFDGLVLEVWLQLAGKIQHDTLIDVVKQIGE